MQVYTHLHLQPSKASEAAIRVSRARIEVLPGLHAREFAFVSLGNHTEHPAAVMISLPSSEFDAWRKQVAEELQLAHVPGKLADEAIRAVAYDSELPWAEMQRYLQRYIGDVLVELLLDIRHNPDRQRHLLAYMREAVAKETAAGGAATVPLMGMVG